MLHHVALVRTDVSEELSASFIRVTRIGELGTTLAVTSNRRTQCPSAARRNIPEDTILHSHRLENVKSYIMELCYSTQCSAVYSRRYWRVGCVHSLLTPLWES
jgi:hypothetical protein